MEYPYILINKHREMMNDPFLCTIHNEIKKIYDRSLPEKYIVKHDSLVSIYSKDVQDKIAKLNKIKMDYIEMYYQKK
jgi:hypothetical protein